MDMLTPMYEHRNEGADATAGPYERLMTRYLAPAGWLLIGMGIAAAFAAAAGPRIGLGSHDQFLTYRLMGLPRGSLFLVSSLIAITGAIFAAPVGQNSWFRALLASFTSYKRAALILSLASLAYLAWAMIFISHFCYEIDNKYHCSLFDDGMISLRYARFAAEGHGLVWNVNSYVEGYTNPLWTMIMTGANLLVAPRLAPLIIQFAGLALAVGVMVISGYTAVKVVKQEAGTATRQSGLWAFAICFIFLCVCYPLHYWSLTGMEVGLVCLCAAAAFNMFVRVSYGELDPELALIGCILLGLVSYFARPDGFIAIVSPTIFIAYKLCSYGAGRWVRPAVTFLCGVILVGLHMWFRYRYYGELVPNTYVLKVSNISLASKLSNGLGFILYAWNYVFLVLAALLSAAFASRRAFIAVIALQVILLCGYQVVVGGDPWPYWRQLVPGIVICATAVAAAFAITVLRFNESTAVVRGRSFLLVIGLSVFALGASNFRFLNEMAFVREPNDASELQKRVLLGVRLKEILSRDAVIGVIWAGALPYYWNGPAIDMLGKSDERIATLAARDRPAWLGMRGVPGHNKYDLAYSIIELKPDLIEGWVWGYDNLTAFVNVNYVEATYKDISVCVRKMSPKVRWQLVTITGQCTNGVSF